MRIRLQVFTLVSRLVFRDCVCQSNLELGTKSTPPFPAGKLAIKTPSYAPQIRRYFNNMPSLQELHLFGVLNYDASDEIGNAISVIMDSAAAVFESLRQRGRDSLVVIKPNWVQESHEYNQDVWEPVITHPKLLVAILDELARRLGGVGTLSVCDAPHTYADFSKILARGNLRQELETLRKRWPRMIIEAIDLRREIWIRKDEVTVRRLANSEDPRGYVRCNLARHSLFYRHPGEGRYYGADFDAGVVNAHHRQDVHEYLLAGTPIKCDLFVNVPKLKTHKKTGITCCLKNLVGINGDKNWLPHHTIGTPQTHGDEFPNMNFANRLETYAKTAGMSLMRRIPVLGNFAYRKMRNLGKSVLGDSETKIRNGNWFGNDTCWRMALDLNRALLYGDSDGQFRGSDDPKPYIGIVDGIMGGQGNGPLCPSPVASHVLFGGSDPGGLDALGLQLMGFDYRDIPIVNQAFNAHIWPIARHARRLRRRRSPR